MTASLNAGVLLACLCAPPRKKSAARVRVGYVGHRDAGAHEAGPPLIAGEVPFFCWLGSERLRR